MIYVSPVEALYQELPWEPEVLANLQSLFINVFGRKIFSDTAVISVAQLNFIVFMVEQVVHIHIVDVALNVLQVNIRLFIPLASSHCAVVLDPIFFTFFIFLFLLIGFIFVGFLQPSMRQDLRYSESGFWLKLNHTTDKSLSFRTQFIWEVKFSF